ncbi:hypothetical protein Pmar_PMAR028408, partial [Perkinsus marinus ATCC 50983]
WAGYKASLDDNLQQVPWSASVDAINSAITLSIVRAARAHIPRGCVSSYKPYWSSELEVLRKQKNRIRHTLQVRRK